MTELKWSIDVKGKIKKNSIFFIDLLRFYPLEFKLKNFFFFIYLKFFTNQKFQINTISLKPLFDFKLKLLIFNTLKKQIFVSFLNRLRFIRSISTGFALTFFENLKKQSKTKISSFLLQLKVILTIIQKCYFFDFLIVQIKGSKKNFFKWLNFMKTQLALKKVLLYVYTPSLNLTRNNLKKIRSIKKNLKKKYIYTEKLI